MKFQVYPDKRGLWRWRLVARNKKIVADSGEGYARKANAIRALQRVLIGTTLMGLDDYEVVTGASK